MQYIHLVDDVSSPPVHFNNFCILTKALSGEDTLTHELLAISPHINLPSRLVQTFGPPTKETLLIIWDNLAWNNEKSTGSAIRPATTLRMQAHLEDGKKDNPYRSHHILIIGQVPQFEYRHHQSIHLFVNAPGVYYYEFYQLIELLRIKDSELIRLLTIPKPLNDNRRKWSPNYLFHVPFRQYSDRRHAAAGLYGWAMIYSVVKKLGDHAREENRQESPFHAVSTWKDPRLKPDLDIHAEQLLYGLVDRAEQLDHLVTNNFKGISAQVSAISEQLRKTKSQIGLIDDEAADIKFSRGGGWKIALEELTGRQEGTLIDILSVAGLHESKPISTRKIADGTPIESLTQKSLNEKTLEVLANPEYNFSCLLIDVRLLRTFDDRGEETTGRIEDLSGTKLIKAIRKKHPSIPILVFTASNKTWKHQYLINECGVDEVWVKEGADENRSAERSFFNVVRLLELIKRMTGPKYQFLYRVGKGIEQIRDEKINYWWSNSAKRLIWKNALNEKKGAFPDKNFNVREKVTQQLNLLQQTLRDYLKHTELIFNELEILSDPLPEPTYSDKAKIISILIGKIIEIIHGYREIENNNQPRVSGATIGWRWNNNSKEFVKNRMDYLAYWLYEHRNESAHFFDNVPFVFFQETPNDPSGADHKNRSLAQLISVLLAYLTCNDGETFPYHGGPYWKELKDSMIKDKMIHKRKASKDFITYTLENSKRLEIRTHFNDFFKKYNFYYSDK